MKFILSEGWKASKSETPPELGKQREAGNVVVNGREYRPTFKGENFGHGKHQQSGSILNISLTAFA